MTKFSMVSSNPVVDSEVWGGEGSGLGGEVSQVGFKLK